MTNTVYGLSSSPEWFTSAVTKSSSSAYKPLSFSKSLDDSTTSMSIRRSLYKAAPPKMKKNCKPVQFNDQEEMVHELQSCDVPAEQLWYSVSYALIRICHSLSGAIHSPTVLSLLQSEEIQEIRQHGKDILAKVKRANGDLDALCSQEESIRGLEHGLSLLDKEALDRSERRKNIVSTILAQQQEQKEAGIDDPKGLQVTSKACTQWARDRARDVADKDFADAVEVWREDAACNQLLPSILEKVKDSSNARRGSGFMTKPATAKVRMTAAERRSTLECISKTVASALEELDDLDF
jgi:hypothetical protein